MTIANYKELLQLTESVFINKKLSIDKYNNLVSLIEENLKIMCINNDKELGEDTKFFNKFYGEIKPLQIFINKLSYDFIQKQNDNAPIDAILYKNNKEQFVECTMAINGQQRADEIGHLKIYNETTQCIPIKTNLKTKASGKKKYLKTLLEARKSNDTKLELAHLIKDRLDNKTNKENTEYNQAILIIAFIRHDYDGLTNNCITEVCKRLTSNISCQFKEIHFVGVPLLSKEQAFICGIQFSNKK